MWRGLQAPDSATILLLSVSSLARPPWVLTIYLPGSSVTCRTAISLPGRAPMSEKSCSQSAEAVSAQATSWRKCKLCWSSWKPHPADHRDPPYKPSTSLPCEVWDHLQAGVLLIPSGKGFTSPSRRGQKSSPQTPRLLLQAGLNLDFMKIPFEPLCDSTFCLLSFGSMFLYIQIYIQIYLIS